VKGSFQGSSISRMCDDPAVLLPWDIISTPRPYHSAVCRQTCGIAAPIALAGDEGRSITMLTVWP
jgi:hypothetical protein